MGPLVSEEQFARVTGYPRAGARRAPSVVTGGERVGNAGYFVAADRVDRHARRR